MSHELLLALALLGTGVGALAQAATGMGFSLVAAPVVVAALGPRDGVAVTLLLGSLSSVLPLARDHRHVDWRSLATILTPTLLLTPVVAWAVRGVETRWLAFAGGLGVVLAVVLLASGLRSAWFRTRTALVVTGASSAALNVVGGVGGPPVGLYAANADWEPRTTRANLTTFFLVQNLVTALVIGPHLPTWPLLAALGAGTVLGTAFAGHLAPGLVRGGVLGLSLLGGVGLLGTAF